MSGEGQEHVVERRPAEPELEGDNAEFVKGADRLEQRHPPVAHRNDQMPGLVIDLDIAHADPGQHLGSFFDVGWRLDHQFEALAADLALEFFGRALGDHMAVVDDGDLVGQLVGLVKKVRRQEEGGAFPDELGDDGPEVDAAARIEPGRGLVEKYDLWLGNERPG